MSASIGCRLAGRAHELLHAVDDRPAGLGLAVVGEHHGSVVERLHRPGGRRVSPRGSSGRTWRGRLRGSRGQRPALRPRRSPGSRPSWPSAGGLGCRSRSARRPAAAPRRRQPRSARRPRRGSGISAVIMRSSPGIATIRGPTFRAGKSQREDAPERCRRSLRALAPPQVERGRRNPWSPARWTTVC